LAVTAGAYAQNTTADRVVVPADKTEATIDIALDAPPAKSSGLTIQPLRDSNNVRISPQPAIEVQSVNGNVLQIHLADVYFWGAAKLTVVSA